MLPQACAQLAFEEWLGFGPRRAREQKHRGRAVHRTSGTCLQGQWALRRYEGYRQAPGLQSQEGGGKEALKSESVKEDACASGRLGGLLC